MKNLDDSIKSNSEIHCVRIKLKKDTVEETKEWFANLMNHKTEILKLLKKENVSIEAVFLDQIAEDFYLIYIMKSKNLKKSQEISQNSEHVLDCQHRDYKKKCWEEKRVLKQLAYFDLNSEIN